MGLGYKIAADLVVFIHLVWILFLIFGVLIGRRIRWVMWTHLGGLGFSIVLQIVSAVCPLTYLEVWLRERHDPELAYPGSFITHYVEELVYLQVDQVLLFWLTMGVVLISFVIYALAIRSGLSKRHDPSG
jgi:hypothetical protein